MRKLTMCAVAALGLGFVGFAGAQANNTQLYFSNDSGPAGVVNVYVDGQEMFANVFPSDSTDFPVALTPGSHKIEVTNNYTAPGAHDLLDQTVTVSAGGSDTLVLADSTDAATDLSGYSLSVDNGTPDGQ